MGLAVITGIAGLVIGFVISYFVMRNNPKYFNLDKMAKAELKALAQKIKDKL